MRHSYEMLIDGESCKSIGYLMATLGDKVDDGMGTSVTYSTSKTNLSTTLRFLGETEKEVLKFNVSLAKISEGEAEYINAHDRDILDYWLTCKSGYREIRFLQGDMVDYKYYGKINNIKWIHVGNQVVSCEFDVETNSPYAHRDDDVIVVTTNKFSIENTSHGDVWSLPTVTFTTGATGDVSIKNITDKGRTFTITGLVSGETITIDCKTGMIKSSTDLNKAKNSNFKYPRLVHGVNEFEVIGSVSSMQFVVGNDVRIGG